MTTTNILYRLARGNRFRRDLTPEEARERRIAHCRRWRTENPDKMKAAAASWSARNKERKVEITRLWKLNNPDAVRAQRNSWKAKHRAWANGAEARREATKLQATPKWADAEKIAAFYTAAREATERNGFSYQVDHIVPLRSPIVCGLHVQNNLMILPGWLNRQKGNRLHSPEFPLEYTL